jgi:hypothetical protein
MSGRTRWTALTHTHVGNITPLDVQGKERGQQYPGHGSAGNF